MIKTIVLNTIGDVNAGDTPIDGNNPADSFTPLVTGVISSIGLVLNENTVDDPGLIDISLYSDSGAGTPPSGPRPNQYLTTLGTFPNAMITVTQAGGYVYDVPISNQYTLTANVRYWVVLSESVTSQAEIAFTNDDVGYPQEYNGYLYPSGGSQLYNIASDASPSGPDLISIETETACFRKGTKIRTIDGEVPVEGLEQGCLVATAGGHFVPVKWVGSRTLACCRHPRPSEVWPIRIKRGAFGPRRPSRDLYLSPDHSIFFDSINGFTRGCLVPVRYLVNDKTILQQATDRVEYYHVELLNHNVLYAEGMTVESYLDTGNRGAFDNVNKIELPAKTPEEIWELSSFAPLVVNGPGLHMARELVLGRARQMKHYMTSDPDLHLLVDGKRVDGVKKGNRITFQVPCAIATVRLASRSARPFAMVPNASDTRYLGVGLTSLSITGVEQLPIYDWGWHCPEPDGQWTDGLADVPFLGGGELTVVVAMTTQYWEI